MEFSFFIPLGGGGGVAFNPHNHNIYIFRHNKLVESKIENIAKKLSIADIALDSEC